MTAEQPASTAPTANHESSDEDKENTMQENTEDDNPQILYTENTSVDIVTNDDT